MVTRSLQTYDDDFLTVASDSPFLAPGDAISNFNTSANGAIFEFQGGAPVTVTLDDTSADQDVFEDSDFANHTVTDGAGLVANGSGVESESTLLLVELDEFGNQVGPVITLTIFSQGGVNSDVWGFHSDTPLVAGTRYEQTSGSASGSTPYSSLDSQPVCYGKGTWIETPTGPCRVEALRPGDLVMTLDSGPRSVRWIRHQAVTFDQPGDNRRPVLIKCDALGKGIPSRDLIVSSNHRILVGGAGQLETIFPSEAFVPAKSLTTLPSIRTMVGRRKITWVHFACDRHEIVCANGCQTESLLMGQMVIRSLNAQERHEIQRLFGTLDARKLPVNGPPARACLRVGSVRRHLAKTGSMIDDLTGDTYRSKAGQNSNHPGEGMPCHGAEQVGFRLRSKLGHEAELWSSG